MMSVFMIVLLCIIKLQFTAPQLRTSQSYPELMQIIYNRDRQIDAINEEANKKIKAANAEVEAAVEAAKQDRNSLLIMRQDSFMRSCSSEQRYNQRYFENAYMNQAIIDSHKMYRCTRDNYLNGTKFAKYIARDPKVPEFGNARYSQLTPQEQDFVRTEFLKNKRLSQAEKWPVFLEWLIGYPDEWKYDVEISNRLLNFYTEYQQAKAAGLTAEVFTECILNAWQRATTIVKLPANYNLAKVFTEFLRVTNPQYIATLCGALLKRVIDHCPISPLSEEKYLQDNWIDPKELLLDIPPHMIKQYGTPPSPETPDWEKQDGYWTQKSPTLAGITEAENDNI